jgi:hypothetical protein
MGKKVLYTEEQKQLVEKNYHEKGMKWCGEQLGIEKWRVDKIAQLLRIEGRLTSLPKDFKKVRMQEAATEREKVKKEKKEVKKNGAKPTKVDHGENPDRIKIKNRFNAETHVRVKVGHGLWKEVLKSKLAEHEAV